MEIKLLGALDYNKIEALLETKIENKEELKNIIDQIKLIETARRCEIVSSAGRLSRATGDVMEIIGLSEDKTIEQNINFAKRVMGIGHDSISDHDYCVFAIKDVSPIVEQTIIEERFASFTIKSRREANFAEAGFYIPNFHDKNGNIIPNNFEVKGEYKNHMQQNFAWYSKLIELGIKKEDARFVLPYCFYSNIIMGMDAHALKDLIIKLTKTKYANITELKEFGDSLYEQAKEKIPYLIPLIDKVEQKEVEAVEEYLSLNVSNSYKSMGLKDETTLLNYTPNVDETIIMAAIMSRYQVSHHWAKIMYNEAICKDQNFKDELMEKIVFESNGDELSFVNFTFQTNLSLAILTHLTRHRTQHILTPDFVPNINLGLYKTPPSIEKLMKENNNNIYHEIFDKNIAIYNHFRNDYGIRDEDLVYFALSGNMVNAITNMDGKTLAHILRLRECTKAQWETRNMAHSMHQAIKNIDYATSFEKILGPTCMTQEICNEGKECCGKIYVLKNTKPTT